MSTFSTMQSNDGKFNFKLETSGNKPLNLFIEIVDKDVTVYDLAKAIYYAFEYQHKGKFRFLHWTTKNLPCKVKHGDECRDIKISWTTSFERMISDIASQISI